jgi:hypothetical protein
MVDDCTHEGLAVEPALAFPSLRVIRVIESVAIARGGLPAILKFDNGPEFTSHAMLTWASKHNVEPVSRRGPLTKIRYHGEASQGECIYGSNVI